MLLNVFYIRVNKRSCQLSWHQKATTIVLIVKLKMQLLACQEVICQVQRLSKFKCHQCMITISKTKVIQHHIKAFHKGSHFYCSLQCNNCCVMFSLKQPKSVHVDCPCMERKDNKIVMIVKL